MPFFRKKDRPSSTRPPTAPEIPELRLLGNQSLTSLAGPHKFGISDSSTDSENGLQAKSAGRPPNGNSNQINGSSGDSSLMKDRKFGTMQNLSNLQKDSSIQQSQSPTKGHRSQSGSLSRSMSQGAVPYHLPWTRNLVRDDSGGMNEITSNEIGQQQQQQQNVGSNLPTRRKMGPPPSAANNAHGLASLFNKPADFRVSPNSIPQPTASQRRHVIDAARSQSLRRAKAPAELNLMMIGGTGTGKTSFVRTLLATCNLSLCTEEAKNSAAFFGISNDHSHPSHDMDPIIPLRTKQYEILQGIELHPNSLIPISALESGVNPASSLQSNKVRPGSMFSSSRMSATTSGFGSGRLQLSICDTPGIDFEMEDDYEVERKVLNALRFLEQKLGKTLSEENKVQRQPRGDGLVHLVLYFIDPRLIIERVQARKELQSRARYAAAKTLKSEKQQQQDEQAQRKRTRSASMIGHSSNPHTINNAGLSKQAQTAQLRQSMDNLQARSSVSSKQKHETKGSKGSISTVELPSNNDTKGEIQIISAEKNVNEANNETYDLDDENLEGLSRQQLSILSRLSERANVLPIIAKADTLTQAQLEEVRTAVRESILKANIDLGAFDLHGRPNNNKKKTSTRVERRPVAKAESAINENSTDTTTQESSQDSTLNSEPVKVIRIKSRRSYSAGAGGGDRVVRSVSGHSFGGHNFIENSTDDGHSTLEHTTPLFDDQQRTSIDAEEDEDVIIPTPESLSKLIPFTLFVPEPIRIRSKDSRPKSNVNLSRINGSGQGLQRKGSMNSIAENLPPVPKIPENVANMKKSPIITEDNTTFHLTNGGEEDKEELMADEKGLKNDDQIQDQENSRQSLESDSVHPSSIALDHTSSTNTNKTSHLNPQPTPLPSMRFQRDFRFGHANVLDSRQCDFSLMRTCILGSHVEKIRDITNERYENFRSHRLELRRMTTTTTTTTQQQ